MTPVMEVSDSLCESKGAEEIVVAVQIKTADANIAHAELQSMAAKDLAVKHAVQKGIGNPRFDDYAPIIPYGPDDKPVTDMNGKLTSFVCFYKIATRLI